ncbi:protein-L-isoaspartate O-methyltransferase [Burkholderia ubonensis]|nr:protein-L-isoaspartate(D-aspartate) O-methyltransferase [Burkholderia ubonensis]KVX93424.1 protein-L-isoaspartate O-methyltransferase [Burkholderia ubonensis]
MSGERAKRFPLALEDLKRAPRKAEGRAGERHAAGDGTRQRLSAGASARGGTVATPAPKSAAAPKLIAPKLVTPVAATRKPAAPKPPAPGPTAGKPAAPPTAPKAASKPAMQMQNAALAGAHALTSERVRERMVERLRANGVADARVLEAMAAVPRHLFVDPGLATQAYEDSALPIGHQQTISKPSVVARMIELAMAGRTLERVLEIGTGCGYQAAVLSHVARDVYSIERIKPLYERAKLNLRPLRVPNIRLHYGDGRVGLPSAAPFDAIVIAAAGLDVPQALLEQLAIGGRLVAPVGGQSGQPQVLTLVERVAPAQWRESRLDRVFFVPLKSGVI